MSFFSRLFGQSPPDPQDETIETWAGGPDDACQIVPGERLLMDQSFEELLREIEIVFGQTQERYLGEVLPILQHAASFMQLLPASRFNHHYKPGGLLFHSLHVAYLTLKYTSSFTPFLPDPRPPRSEHEEFVFYARLLFATAAMVHDIGKVATDFDLRFLDARQGNVLDLPSYDINGRGGFCSQSLVDFAREHVGDDLSKAFYRWNHRNGRHKNGHHSYLLPAVNELLRSAGTRLPASVRKHYLDPDTDTYAKMIRLIRKSDRDSCKHYLENHPALTEFGRHGLHPRTLGCVGVLRYLAVQQHLNELDEVCDCCFLPLKLMNRLLPTLPKLDDFSFAPVSSPIGFLEAAKGCGFHIETDPNPYGSNILSTHKGEQGLFLNKKMTRSIKEWAQNPDRFRSPVDGDQEAAIVRDDQTAEPAISPDSGHSDSRDSSPIPEPDDVSSCGVAIPSDDSQDEYADMPWPESIPEDTTASLSSLQPEHPEDCVAVALDIESLSPKDLENTDICRDEDGRLTFLKVFVEGLLRKHKIYDVRRFRAQSEEKFSEYWTVLGNRTQQGLQLSLPYSQAVKDRNSAHYLLLTGTARSQSQTSVSAESTDPVSPSSAPVQSEVVSAPKPEKRNNPSQSPRPRKELSLQKLLAAVRSSTRKSRSNKPLSIDEGLFPVPISLIDEYIGDKVRRGELIHILLKEDALSRRTKKYFYLKTENQEVAACLADLQAAK